MTKQMPNLLTKSSLNALLFESQLTSGMISMRLWIRLDLMKKQPLRTKLLTTLLIMKVYVLKQAFYYH